MPRIPIFPLRTVLVPGLVLPLHIFEPRYRLMIQMLGEAAESERAFGVVALRPGSRCEDWESMYPIGTMARLVEVDQLEDGRYDIVTVGAERFQILSVDEQMPFRRADVALLDEPEEVTQPSRSVGVPDLARQAASLLVDYRRRIAGWGVIDLPEIAHMPSDPTALSYLVAAAMVVDLPVHQELLAIPTTSARLAAECELLRGELSVMGAIASLPAVDLATGSISSN